jgi:peptidyl-dipeptidase A
MSEPGAAEVAKFLEDVEAQLLELSIESLRADWVYSTFITEDTETLASRAYSRLMTTATDLAKRSMEYLAPSLSPAEARKLKLLRLILPLVAPSDPRDAAELSRRTTAMSSTFAKGRYTPHDGSEPLDLQGLSRILQESRSPAVLEDVWSGWHRVGRAIRPDFVRYVELANRGARELGFSDLGAMWRSKYDMDPEEFAKEVDRLWEEVRPLYVSLHRYVRRRLALRYGTDLVPERGPIPVYLLGNMWAQSWDGIYPLLAPESDEPGYDLTQLLVERKTTPADLVRYAERFFVSLGFDPLPATFWSRSMLERPQDREVVCHASAWDVDFADDLRIKLCVEITGEDFNTIHHEIGHNYYQRAYSRQPFLFRDSAHDGFHEAVGDTIQLSVTPEYLVKVGLLSEPPSPDRDLGLLLHRALEKVAFLPFGLVVDQWRWRVFSGEVGPNDYNRTWWQMREKYQGVAPPPGRGEEEFDPGAKFHVPANTPYMRYFLAHILQFQFHRALARAVSASGPLHRVSVYGSLEAGRRLRSMLEMGQSREWRDALEVVTGERRMSARGLLEYFAPLQRWLDEQDPSVPSGW